MPGPAGFSKPSTSRDIIRLVAGTMILGSVALGTLVSPLWLVLGAFVGVNLLQSAFSRWCLLESLLTRAGISSPCRQPAA
ncbi:MAG: YgaP family membrane protein [Myxococcota bacterium]